MIGATPKPGTPLKPGCRKTFVYGIYTLTAKTVCFLAGMSVTLKKVEMDYSEYLGKDYLKTQKKVKMAPTLVSNHLTWLDSVIVWSCMKVAFACSDAFYGMTVVRTLQNQCEGLWIPRGRDEKAVKGVLKAIADRQ